MRTFQTLGSITLPLLLWLMPVLAEATEIRTKKSPPLVLKQNAEGVNGVVTWQENSGLLTLSVESATSSARSISMSRRVKIWKPMLEELFRKATARDSYLLGVGEYPELRDRVALAAVQSNNWDLRSGKPRSGSAEDALARLLEKGDTIHELRDLFQALGFEISVQSIENVLRCRWSELNPITREKADAPAEAIVPCGAALLFKLRERKREQ